jgi:hypothetical protein
MRSALPHHFATELPKDAQYMLSIQAARIAFARPRV